MASCSSSSLLSNRMGHYGAVSNYKYSGQHFETDEQTTTLGPGRLRQLPESIVLFDFVNEILQAGRTLSSIVYERRGAGFRNAKYYRKSAHPFPNP